MLKKKQFEDFKIMFNNQIVSQIDPLPDQMYYEIVLVPIKKS
jgi:hypothetical protein